MTGAERRRAGPGQRARQREDTKRRLLAATERLIVARPVADVSVTEIARAAGVSPSLINSHFGGKGGLILALVRALDAPCDAAARRIAAEPGTPEARLAALLACYAEADLGRPGLLAARQAYGWLWPAETEARRDRDREPHLGALAAIVDDGTQKGAFRTVDPQFAAETVLALHAWMARRALLEGWPARRCAESVLARARALLAPA